jgi:hypothetical protein
VTIRNRTIVFVALCLLLVACGGGKKKAAPTTTAPPTTAAPTTTAAPPPVYPLTGLPATDPAKLVRPALVVKIDNADGDGRGNQARPQTGLNQADVVYEEKVEGAVTRLAAIFHSQDSDPVGPIRSARSTDVAVFSPLNRPLFAWSGANPTFAAIIHDSPIVDVGYDAHSEAYGRRDDKIGPHDLYSSTPDLFALAPPDAKPPPALFVYRKKGEPMNAGAAPIGSMNLNFGGGGGAAPVDYGWDAARGGFGRSQRGSLHVDEAGVQIAPANVIVQFTDYVDTGITDVVGTPVPEAQLVGFGRALILTNGMVIEATWAKTAPEAVPTYSDTTGKPIKLTPGQTFVELVPNDGGSATVTG